MPLQVGDRVRFSAAGEARVRSMPEAWGLHTALTRGETGMVTDRWEPEAPGEPAQVSVEFPTGTAGCWDEESFALAGEESP